MKKAGTCPAFDSLPCGLLLVHLVYFLVGLLGGHLLFLLVHLLVHLLVLRDRGQAHAREHRRDQDCNELLHCVVLSLVGSEKNPLKAQSALLNAPSSAKVDKRRKRREINRIGSRKG